MSSYFAQCTHFHGDIDETPWMSNRPKRSSISPSSSVQSSPTSTEPGRGEIEFAKATCRTGDRQLESDSYFSHSPVHIAEFPSASLPRRSVVCFRKKGNQVYSDPLNNAPTYQVRSFDGNADLIPYQPPPDRRISNASMDYAARPETSDSPSPMSSHEAEAGAAKPSFDFSRFVTQVALNAQPRRRSKHAKQSPSTEQQEEQQPSLRRTVSKIFAGRNTLGFFGHQDGPPSPPSTTRPGQLHRRSISFAKYRNKYAKQPPSTQREEQPPSLVSKMFGSRNNSGFFGLQDVPSTLRRQLIPPRADWNGGHLNIIQRNGSAQASCDDSCDAKAPPISTPPLMTMNLRATADDRRTENR